MSRSLSTITDDMNRIRLGGADLSVTTGTLDSRIVQEAFFYTLSRTDLGDRQVLTAEGLRASSLNTFQNAAISGTSRSAFENAFQFQLSGSSDMRGLPPHHAFFKHYVAYLRILREALERYIETLKG